MPKLATNGKIRQINQEGRLPMHTSFWHTKIKTPLRLERWKKSANYLSLEGIWKFKWVEDADQRPTDFFIAKLDDSQWSQISVPGIWEVNGLATSLCECGLRMARTCRIHSAYRAHQTKPRWQLSQDYQYSRLHGMANAIAHFGSVTSNLCLYVNGKFVGYSEDSKLIRIRRNKICKARRKPLRFSSVPLVRRHLSGVSGLLAPQRCGTKMLSSLLRM